MPAEAMAPADCSLQDALSFIEATHPNLNISGDGAGSLRQELEDQPFALVLAATYMRENDCSVKDYISQICDLRASTSFELTAGVPDPVCFAVHLSFACAGTQNPRSAALLSTMSVLETGDIPEAILIGEKESLRSFHGAVRRLRGFGLIRVSPDETMLSLELPIHICAQTELRRQGRLCEWQQKAVSLLSAVFPHGDSSQWRACDVLMPHVDRVLLYDLSYESDDEARMEHAILLKNVGSYLELHGNFDAAFKKLDQVLKLYKSEGKPNIAYSDAIYDESALLVRTVEKKIVNTLITQGKFKEAEARAQIIQAKLTASSKKSDSRLLEALLFSNTMGSILHRQGRFKEAEPLYKEALEANIILHDKSHVDSFNIETNLAQLYVDMGKYKAARAMHKTLVADQERILGPTHHNTIYARQMLAKAMAAEGDYSAAAETNEEVLRLAEQVLGSKHPDTLSTKNDLAIAMKELGNFSRSEALHREVLACRLELGSAGKTAAGEAAAEADINVISSRTNLATVLEKQGKYADAASILEVALASASSELGDRHPVTLTITNTLGLVFLRQGKFTEAESMIAPLLGINEELYGKDHAKTMTVRNNLGGCLQRQGRWKEAIYHHRTTMETAADPRGLGAKHPFSLRSRNNVAEALREMAEAMRKDPNHDPKEIAEALEEAKELQEQALQWREEVLGPGHLDTLTSCFNLGQVLHAQGRHQEAGQKYDAALQGFLASSNSQSQTVTACREKKALLEQDMALLEQASL